MLAHQPRGLPGNGDDPNARDIRRGREPARHQLRPVREPGQMVHEKIGGRGERPAIATLNAAKKDPIYIGVCRQLAILRDCRGSRPIFLWTI